jgi:uncharacterized membrane protein
VLRSWRRNCAWLLLIASTLWAAAILVAPRVVASGAEHPVWSDLGALTYLVGGLVCHQRPERSFHAAGVQYPVCARCTGLYLSAALGAWLMFLGLLGLLGRWGGVSLARWRGLLLLAIVPTVVSIVLEWAGGPSGTVSRALAAVPAGAVAGAFVLAAVMGLFVQEFGTPGARVAGRGSGV